MTNLNILEGDQQQCQLLAAESVSSENAKSAAILRPAAHATAAAAADDDATAAWLRATNAAAANVWSANATTTTTDDAAAATWFWPGAAYGATKCATNATSANDEPMAPATAPDPGWLPAWHGVPCHGRRVHRRAGMD